MINSQFPQVRAFILHNKLDLSRSKPHVLQRWIYNANEMYRKAEKRPMNDIRRYCEC